MGWQRWTAFAAVALAFACDDGGNGEINVQPTGLLLIDVAGDAIRNPVLDIGHPSRIGLRIRSSSAVADLAVHFYIIDREQFDADPDAATQFLLGAASIDLVAAGETTYPLELPIPYTDRDFDETGAPVYDGDVLVASRDYYLFAQLDPADRLIESNEEDNRPALTAFGFEAPLVLLSDAKKDAPNVYLSEVILDVDLRMVDQDLLSPEPQAQNDFCTELPPEPDPADPFDELVENFGNTQLGLSAVLSATGAWVVQGRPTPIPRVDLQAVLRWQGPGPADQWAIPVRIWDSETDAYTDRLSILEVAPGEPRSVHVDLRLDASLDPSIAQELGELQTYLMDALPVCIDPVSGECGIDLATCQTVQTLEECVATADLACAWDCFARETGQGSVDIEVTAWSGVGDGAVLLPGVELPGFELVKAGELPEIHIAAPSISDAAEEVCQGACPPPSGSQRFETSFAQDFSSAATERLASARVDFDAMAALDLLGASASANGRAELTLFGRDFEVMGLAANGSASPTDPDANFFELDLRSDFAFSSNRILFSKEMAPCQGGITVDVDDLAWEVLSQKAEERCIQDCAGNTACEQDCKALVQGFEQSKEVQRTFFISIVPVTATFSAGAGVGFSTGIGLPECQEQAAGLFKAHAGPYAEVDSEVSAGIGIPGFSVGAAAQATLLEDTFFARAQVVDLGIDIAQGGLVGTLGEDVINTLTGPNGGGYLFARYPCGIKWCGWYPCLKTCTAKKQLFHFETFEKRDVLFCDSQDVFVGL